jgi:hypothetical protein
MTNEVSAYFKSQATAEPDSHKTLHLKSAQVRFMLHKFSFSHRIVNTWNSLSEDNVASESVNTFKTQLDQFRHVEGLYKA